MSFPLDLGPPRVAVRTNVGRVRKNNEDTVATARVTVGGNQQENEVQEFAVLALADGMGGHGHGEVASAMAVRSFLNMVMVDFQPGTDLPELVRRAVGEANRTVHAMARRPEYDGMGTTLVGAVVVGDTVHLGNVGDSRGYVVEAGRQGLVQKTKDHSLVQELTDLGKLAPGEAETHPQRNVITRSIGAEPTVEADVFSFELQGRTLLLCSDGLTKMLSDPEILAALDPDVEASADNLIRTALTKGGIDNVSVVLYARGPGT